MLHSLAIITVIQWLRIFKVSPLHKHIKFLGLLHFLELLPLLALPPLLDRLLLLDLL